MAGWRVGFLVGNAEIVAALTKLKSYLDYGTFQPVQIAAIVAMNEALDYPGQLRTIYQSRRDTLIEGLDRVGLAGRGAAGIDVRLGADARALPRDGLTRVLAVPHRGGRRRDQSGRRLRRRAVTSTCASPSSRTSCAPPGRAQPASRAHEARLIRACPRRRRRPRQLRSGRLRRSATRKRLLVGAVMMKRVVRRSVPPSMQAKDR